VCNIQPIICDLNQFANSKPRQERAVGEEEEETEVVESLQQQNVDGTTTTLQTVLKKRVRQLEMEIMRLKMRQFVHEHGSHATH
jgi:hypothetical protein